MFYLLKSQKLSKIYIFILLNLVFDSKYLFYHTNICIIISPNYLIFFFSEYNEYIFIKTILNNVNYKNQLHIFYYNILL